MPIDKYYGGHGRKVMTDMKRRYGDKKGERVFHATAKKRKLKQNYRALGLSRTADPDYQRLS